MKVSRRNILGLALSTLVPGKLAAFSSVTISKYNPFVLKVAMNSIYGKIGPSKYLGGRYEAGHFYST